MNATTLDRWRDEGRRTIGANVEHFRRLVTQARTLADRGHYAAAAMKGCAAAYFAQYRHCGMFCSPELEQILLEVGRRAVTQAAAEGVDRQAAVNPRRVLHVATNVAGFGGIPGLIRRWIQQDAGRSHSLALTKQAPQQVPGALREVVQKTGGRIHVLNRHAGGLVARARRLRDTAAAADVIVLHAWEQDVVPLMAFAHKDRLSPILYVNHGDHWFWLGSAIADVVVNLRESGLRLSVARRNIAPERNLLLPTIMEPVERTMSRAEAKRRLGLSPECTMLLSIARAPKFKTVDGVTFADAHIPALERRPEAVLVVVGCGDRPDWSSAVHRTGGRIKTVSPTNETAVHYQAADIYVDSYPFGSNTSLLQAAAYGVPVVSRHPYSADCDILGSDMPGLDGHLVRVADLETYTNAVLRLIADEAYRVELGEATRCSVAAKHWGCDWQSALERAYERAARVPPATAPRELHDRVWLGEPDVHLQRIHGDSFDADWVARFHLGVLPLTARCRQWLRLSARGGRLPYARLLPEWLYCRVAELGGVGR